MDTAPTLVDLFAYYADEYLGSVAPTTRYQYATLHQRLLRLWGPLPLTAVTPDLLRTWKRQLRARCGPGTVHRYMRMLSATLRVAVDECGWLEAHPMAKVTLPAPPDGVVRFLSQEERVALLDACHASPHPYLHPIVVVALLTGGRKNEIRSLQWPAVDLAAGVVHFLRTKGKRARSVPLVGDAWQVLTALHAVRLPRVPWVFPSPSGRGPVAIESAWRTARKASGVVDFRFHDLRHTFASYLAMSGASLRDIAELLGHKKIQQSMLYSHLLPSHTRGVVQTMVDHYLPPQARP